MSNRRSITLRSQWNLLKYPERCDSKAARDTVFNSNLFTTLRTSNDGHQTTDHCILTAMKSLVLILVLAAASMSAHVPEERDLLATNSLLSVVDPLLALATSLLPTLLSVLIPIVAALLNVVASLAGSLLGTALAVVHGLLTIVINIVSQLVDCVTAAINIPVGNIVKPILGTVTSAVSSIISNLTESTDLIVSRGGLHLETLTPEDGRTTVEEALSSIHNWKMDVQNQIAHIAQTLDASLRHYPHPEVGRRFDYADKVQEAEREKRKYLSDPERATAHAQDFSRTSHARRQF
ncbi:hypothetical protein C0Q70_02175 [Pomacea canaliculata]|uniref:Uncharacterized protein n=1 Tax=Pomacea canaliculata TaxID=400727 RepID=A0A2T7Q1L3_POMCA|nr:hypothetical protein C0Q70_02175 [Pomacea canaliculata]